MRLFQSRLVRYSLGTFLLLVALAYAFCLPRHLFRDPVSTVVEDRDNQLLGARIAADGQWRFPEIDSVPYKFEQALLTFEDKRFYKHRGVDPLAIARAMRLNIKQKRVVSGGSTLSMQTIRISRKGQGRTITEKIIEAIQALRLEETHTKEDILKLYASHAPFGGNIVGLDAAAWKYFGRSPHNLTWAESAMLAVLPNSPALIHPGRNRQKLLDKRNALLDRLAEKGLLDETSVELSKAEPLPEKPIPLPNLAPHLTDRFLVEQNNQKDFQRVSRQLTTIDANLQRLANDIVNRQHLHLREQAIHNAAALIINTETGDILAYVGNTRAGKDHNQAVDVIQAPRSSGSILKPFLYAAMLSEGEMLPDMLVEDIPSYYGAYQPKNYDKTYSGVIPAGESLIRSLNVPAVRLLYDYGVDKFQNRLQHMGMTTLHRAPADYGLTLILGGAEVSLLDLGTMYSGMGRMLTEYQSDQDNYPRDPFEPISYKPNRESSEETARAYLPLQPGGVYSAFEMMTDLRRPAAAGRWKNFASSRFVAWKTGTSFGFRDAWAVGVTPEYTVAVWVGNADGEGRPGIIGVEAAAPLLFDIFDVLPGREWFDPPYDDLESTPVCRFSGYLPTRDCEQIDTVFVPGYKSFQKQCPYHEQVFIDTQGKRVTATCADAHEMTAKSFVVLPPVADRFYREQTAQYQKLPSYRSDCIQAANQSSNTSELELAYPRNNARLYIPTELDGTRSGVVFEAVHRRDGATIHWHLNDEYLGNTDQLHTKLLAPPPGKHTITLVDERGLRHKTSFTILNQSE